MSREARRFKCVVINAALTTSHGCLKNNRNKRAETHLGLLASPLSVPLNGLTVREEGPAHEETTLPRVTHPERPCSSSGRDASYGHRTAYRSGPLGHSHVTRSLAALTLSKLALASHRACTRPKVALRTTDSERWPASEEVPLLGNAPACRHTFRPATISARVQSRKTTSKS